jgi:hypothetical protein
MARTILAVLILLQTARCAFPAPTLTILPDNFKVESGEHIQFVALLGSTPTTQITWYLSPTVGSISSTGLYSAPAAVSQKQAVTITGIMDGSSALSASATITVLPVGVLGLNPDTTTLEASEVIELLPSISMLPIFDFTPQIGTLSANFYTAPSSIITPNSITITATDPLNAANTASAVISLVTTKVNTNFAAEQGQQSLTLTYSNAVTSFGLIGLIITNDTPDDALCSIMLDTGSNTLFMTDLDSGIIWPVAPVLQGTFCQLDVSRSQTTVGHGSVQMHLALSISGSLTQTGSLYGTVQLDNALAPTLVYLGTLSPSMYVPLNVTASPAAATLLPGQTQQFKAAVSGSSNTAVIWSVNPAVGTISASGLYTAPAAITSQQLVTVTATSVADSTTFATASVALDPLAISNLTVVGTTPTQAVLSYNTPNSALCTFTVNEGDILDPAALVPDVDPNKFGLTANSDGRFGSIVNGTFRVVVIGERTTQQGIDGNYYSRALRANRLHSFQVMCGSAIASVTFTTRSPQFGNTYPERYGQWPTISSMTSGLIDPLTGIPLWPLVLNPNGWPAGPRNIFCSESPVRSGDGYNGYACVFPSTRPAGDDLWFVDTTDSIFRNTGQISTIWGEYSGDPLDILPAAQNTIYSPALNSGAGGLLTVASNTSSNVPVLMSGAYTGGWMANDFAASWTNLTPSASTGGLPGLMDAYDSHFNIEIQNNNATPLGLTGDGLHFAVWFNQGIQNGIGWVGVFDMHGNVSAALPFHLSSKTRWCGEHSATVVEDSNGLLSFEPAANRFTGTGWEMDSGGGNDGDGPWLSTVTTGTLTSTPTYPAGSPINGFPGLTCTYNGLTIMGCDVVTVAGEPCDPTPGNLETNNCPQPGFSGYYLMSAQVGDRVMAVDSLGSTNDRENMIIIGIRGNQWVLARGAPDQACLECNNLVQDHPGLSALGMACSPNFQTDNITWNWMSDPHGTGSGIATDNGTGIGGTLNNEISEHTTAGDNAMGGALDWWQCEAVDPNLNVDCIGIKTGPAGSYMGTLPVAVGPGTPAFAGIWPYPVSSYVEHYTSGPPSSPTVANPNFVIDARPYESVVENWIPLGSDVYQVTGTGINPQTSKATPLDSSCGGYPMIDVSSPTTSANGPVPGLVAPYSYCLANAAGECYAGSVPGNVYSSCSTGVGDQTQTWLTVAGATYGKLTQYRWDDPNYLGRNLRVLTSCGRPKSQQTSYWSGRVLPYGDYGLCYSDFVKGVNEPVIMLMGLPPLPSWDGIDRTTWVPVSVPIAAGHGTAAVEFGYIENSGTVATYFNCTTRQDVCEVASPTIESPPFYYASEGVRPMGCDSGCSIQIPAISGRVVFYQIVHGDGYPEPLQAFPVQ